MRALPPNAAFTWARASATSRPRNWSYCCMDGLGDQKRREPSGGLPRGECLDRSNGRCLFDLAERKNMDAGASTLGEGTHVPAKVGPGQQNGGAPERALALRGRFERLPQAAHLLGVERAAGAAGEIPQRTAEHLLDVRVEDDRMQDALCVAVGGGDLAEQSLPGDLGELLGVLGLLRGVRQRFEQGAKVADAHRLAEQVAEDLEHVAE